MRYFNARRNIILSECEPVSIWMWWLVRASSCFAPPVGVLKHIFPLSLASYCETWVWKKWSVQRWWERRAGHRCTPVAIRVEKPITVDVVHIDIIIPFTRFISRSEAAYYILQKLPRFRTIFLCNWFMIYQNQVIIISVLWSLHIK